MKKEKAKNTTLKQNETKGKRIQTLQSTTLLELIEWCDICLNDSGLSQESITEAKPILHQLAQRLNLTDDEAMWLCAIFNQGGFCRIDYNDICRYFGCRPVKALQYKSLFDSLVKKGCFVLLIMVKANTAYQTMCPMPSGKTKFLFKNNTQTSIQNSFLKPSMSYYSSAVKVKYRMMYYRTNLSIY